MQFSDEVVGTVEQRVDKLLVPSPNLSSAKKRMNHGRCDARPTKGMLTRTSFWMLPPTSSSKRTAVIAFQSPYSGFNRPVQMVVENIEAVDFQQLKVEWDSLLEERRERGRLNQQRYRRRQKERLRVLEACNVQLQTHIPLLELERDEIRDRTLVKKTRWVVALEYVHIFQHGFRAWEGAWTRDLELLWYSMSPDVAHNAGFGVETLDRSWRDFTSLFPDIHIELKRLNHEMGNSFSATTTTSFTITSTALKSVFPHLIESQHVDGRCPQIVAKLQDQRIVMQGSVWFNWDNTTDRVVGLYSQSDLISPLLQLLGNLEDVALVFKDALITAEGNLVQARRF